MSIIKIIVEINDTDKKSLKNDIIEYLKNRDIEYDIRKLEDIDLNNLFDYLYESSISYKVKFKK